LNCKKQKKEEEKKKGSKTTRLEFLAFIINTTKGVWVLAENNPWGIKHALHAPRGNATFATLLLVNE